MEDTRVLRTLRTMAWSRAKGELQSMLETYWEEAGRFDDMQAAIEYFVDTVESNGLQE